MCSHTHRPMCEQRSISVFLNVAGNNNYDIKREHLYFWKNTMSKFKSMCITMCDATILSDVSGIRRRLHDKMKSTTYSILTVSSMYWSFHPMDSSYRSLHSSYHIRKWLTNGNLQYISWIISPNLHLRSYDTTLVCVPILSKYIPLEHSLSWHDRK